METQEAELISGSLRAEQPLYDMSVYNRSAVDIPLYEGASTTVLDSLIEQFSWFGDHPGISKEALSDMLYMLHHHTLPPHNMLPDSYDSAMKVIEPFLVTPVVFHACPNDCIIYRGDYMGLDTCPVCHSSRFLTGSTPAKRYTYLPIGPRLERLFGTASLSEIVQSHLQLTNDPDDDYMYDIHDSPAWREAYAVQDSLREIHEQSHLLCVLMG